MAEATEGAFRLGGCLRKQVYVCHIEGRGHMAGSSDSLTTEGSPLHPGRAGA